MSQFDGGAPEKRPIDEVSRRHWIAIASAIKATPLTVETTHGGRALYSGRRGGFRYVFAKSSLMFFCRFKSVTICSPAKNIYMLFTVISIIIVSAIYSNSKYMGFLLWPYRTNRVGLIRNSTHQIRPGGCVCYLRIANIKRHIIRWTITVVRPIGSYAISEKFSLVVNFVNWRNAVEHKIWSVGYINAFTRNSVRFLGLFYLLHSHVSVSAYAQESEKGNPEHGWVLSGPVALVAGIVLAADGWARLCNLGLGWRRDLLTVVLGVSIVAIGVTSFVWGLGHIIPALSEDTSAPGGTLL